MTIIKLVVVAPLAWWNLLYSLPLFDGNLIIQTSYVTEMAVIKTRPHYPNFILPKSLNSTSWELSQIEFSSIETAPQILTTDFVKFRCELKSKASEPETITRFRTQDFKPPYQSLYPEDYSQPKLAPRNVSPGENQSNYKSLTTSICYFLEFDSKVSFLPSNLFSPKSASSHSLWLLEKTLSQDSNGLLINQELFLTRATKDKSLGVVVGHISHHDMSSIVSNTISNHSVALKIISEHDQPESDFNLLLIGLILHTNRESNVNIRNKNSIISDLFFPVVKHSNFTCTKANQSPPLDYFDKTPRIQNSLTHNLTIIPSHFAISNSPKLISSLYQVMSHSVFDHKSSTTNDFNHITSHFITDFGCIHKVIVVPPLFNESLIYPNFYKSIQHYSINRYSSANIAYESTSKKSDPFEINEAQEYFSLAHSGSESSITKFSETSNTSLHQLLNFFMDHLKLIIGCCVMLSLITFAIFYYVVKRKTKS